MASERNLDMVAAGVEGSGPDFGLDHLGINDLLGIPLRLAAPRADLARSLAAIKGDASAEGSKKRKRGKNRNPRSNCKRITRVLDA